MIWKPTQRFELWHTFVTLEALLIVSLILNGTGLMMADYARRGSLAGAAITGIFIGLGIAAAVYLLLQLTAQARLFVRGLRDGRRKTRWRKP